MIDKDSWTIVEQYATPWDMMFLAMTCKRYAAYPRSTKIPAVHIIMQAIETRDERFIAETCQQYAAKASDWHSLIGWRMRNYNLIKALSAACPYICGPAWLPDKQWDYKRQFSEYIEKLQLARQPPTPQPQPQPDEKKASAELVIGTANIAVGSWALDYASGLTASGIVVGNRVSSYATGPQAIVSGSAIKAPKNIFPDGQFSLQPLHFVEPVRSGEFALGSRENPLEVVLDQQGKPMGMIARINGYRCMIPLTFLPDF